jgi:hypothetical protein
MKYLMLMTLLASVFSTSAFAVGQTNTECPMMREMMKRNNPKADMVGKNLKMKNEFKSAQSSKQ